MLKRVKRRLLNLPGWHTKRKIVVIDSDDWGSIALPSPEVFENIREAGFIVENNPYLMYDSLASENDLKSLFETLILFKDINGKHPVFTANTVVANPDFDRIRESGYSQYYYEPFTETLKKYSKHGNSFGIWKQGLKEGLFYPQFHAREHLNVAYWMSALREDHPKIHLGFDNRFYILDTATHPSIEHSCTSAHYPKNAVESREIENATREGLSIFKELFGYSSKSFTGTGYIWHSNMEQMLKAEGVEHLKGLIVQREPRFETGGLRVKYHYTGQRNRLGQVHLVRNAFFEPGLSRDKDKCIADCLDRIDTAFRSRKPAIISTHRINYIGFIDEKFRHDNLKRLQTLLTHLTKKHPEVEFMTSEELGVLISFDGLPSFSSKRAPIDH